MPLSVHISIVREICVTAYRDPLLSPTQCLCLAPTYELALQTGRVVEQMGKFCVDVQVMYAIRGNPSMCLEAGLAGRVSPEPTANQHVL